MRKVLTLIDRWVALKTEFPEWRLGQALVNALVEIDLELAGRLCGDGRRATDPYYDDKKIPALFEALLKEEGW